MELTSGFPRREKRAAYRDAGILTQDEGTGGAGTLIITRDDDAGGIDAQAIAKVGDGPDAGERGMDNA